MNLAEAAVELLPALAPLRELSYAVYLETIIARESLRECEELSARMGLPTAVARGILEQQAKRVSCLADAHTILKALIPYQDEIDCLVSEASRGVALLSAPGAPAIPPSRLPGTQAGAPLSSALVSRDIEQPRFHV